MVTNNDVFKPNHTAVITGASSGIGRAASLECALKGMHVWMVDVDEEELQRTKNDIKEKVGDAFVGQVSESCFSTSSLLLVWT